MDLLGLDSSVGIATRYGVDGPGIESQWGRDFRARPDQLWGLPIPHTMTTGSFRGGGKVVGAWC
jgi:hypothetical protein